ncbi:MAG: phosphate transport system substrate-binding [Erysipelotrichaceae bacterium]|nr:MAG: phosphate transport system substrate-binding [Erysipelotrichaceae bacterium]
MICLLFGLSSCSTTVIKPAERVSFTMETYPDICGSTVAIPLEEMLMATLTDQSIEKVRPFIPITKTDEAYNNLLTKTSSLIFVTSPSQSELDLAKSANITMEIVPIISEAFVFLVNKDNIVDSLTLDQVRKIYTGEIVNWKEVGGNDVPIRAMQRPVNSGSQTGFLDLVMKGLTVMEPPVEWISADMDSLIDMVAHYDNKPDAIGYSYYYYVTDMIGNPNVKLLKINDIAPSEKSISDSTYPIHTNYYAVFRKSEAQDSDVRKIVAYLLSEEGQELIEAAGYVRLK